MTQNCWFAVKASICNLETHAQLHDCTRLRTSDHEDFGPKNKRMYSKHGSRTSLHTNPTVSSIDPSHRHSHTDRCDPAETTGCIISPMLWNKDHVVCCHLMAEMLPKRLLLWNMATLWFQHPSVRVLEWKHFVLCIVMLPYPPLPFSLSR